MVHAPHTGPRHKIATYRQPHTGFTLLEMLMVLAILTLLAGIIVSAVRDATESAHDGRRLQDMNTIVNAIQRYHFEHRAFPGPNDSGVIGNAGTCRSAFENDILSGDHLQRFPVDPAASSCTDSEHYYYWDATRSGLQYCVAIGTLSTASESDMCNNFAKKFRSFGAQKRSGPGNSCRVKEVTSGGDTIAASDFNVCFSNDALAQ